MTVQLAVPHPWQRWSVGAEQYSYIRFKPEWLDIVVQWLTLLLLFRKTRFKISPGDRQSWGFSWFYSKVNL